jgi:hypothetical protein
LIAGIIGFANCFIDSLRFIFLRKGLTFILDIAIYSSYNLFNFVDYNNVIIRSENFIQKLKEKNDINEPLIYKKHKDHLVFISKSAYFAYWSILLFLSLDCFFAIFRGTIRYSKEV